MSKIPEGATHQAADANCYSTGGVQYYKFEDDRWLYWPEVLSPKGVWHECPLPCKTITPIAPTWNGPEDGLPPVGLEVEVHSDAPHEAYKGHVGARVRIIAHDVLGEGDDEGTAVAVYHFNNENGEGYHALIAGNFRPIRTAEQPAAEAHRAKYMPQLVKLWDADTGRTEFLEAVYAMIAEAGKP